MLLVFLLLLNLTTRADDLLRPSIELIPNPAALMSWQDVSYYRTSNQDLQILQRTIVKCQSQSLFATNPQQSTKLYHLFRSATYDQKKLVAGDAACVVGMKTAGRSGVKNCLMADTLYYTLMSDTFVDECGNYYRGFWQVVFLQRDENMGTLFGKGRTLYPAAHPRAPNDQQLGATYATEVHDFLFFTELFAGDQELISSEASQALREEGFHKQGPLFVLDSEVH